MHASISSDYDFLTVLSPAELCRRHYKTSAYTIAPFSKTGSHRITNYARVHELTLRLFDCSFSAELGRRHYKTRAES